MGSLRPSKNLVKLGQEQDSKTSACKSKEGMDSVMELEAVMEEVVAGRASEAQVTALLLGLK